VNLIFLGAPSSGKGTQAKRLAGELKLSHLATGDLLREAASHGTDSGKLAKPIMDRGELVPDELVIAIVREALGEIEGGIVFDGFPRTNTQAVVLDEMLSSLGRPVDQVIYFDVPEEMLVKRAAKRWLCSNRSCQQPFAAPGVCTVCDSSLYQREDDEEATMRNRLKAYHRSTIGLLDYYAGKDLLVRIDAVGKPVEVSQRILDSLKGSAV